MRDKRQLSTPDEVLNAALAKEYQSRQFCAGLAEKCRIDMVRQLIEKLKNEDEKHVKMVEEISANVRLGRRPV